LRCDKERILNAHDPCGPENDPQDRVLIPAAKILEIHFLKDERTAHAVCFEKALKTLYPVCANFTHGMS
jgi:hypothetical protein